MFEQGENCQERGRCAYRKVVVFLVLVLVLVLSASARGTYVEEKWDSSSLTHHNWSYWNENSISPHNEWDVYANWQETGGVGGSGHVWAPLSLLTSEHHNQAYWPMFLTTDIDDADGSQEVDLSFGGAAVKIYMKDRTLATPVNLQGGSVHLFVGEWIPAGIGGPVGDKYRFFYNKKPLKAPTGTWVESTVPIGGDSDWGVIAIDGLPANASDLFNTPQQWGFCIFGATDQPTGELAFDSFGVVPEPVTLSMLALGGLALLHRNKKRSGRRSGC